MADAAYIFLAYLIGSLPFAVIVSRALGLPDPRSYGSGNPGATNVLRTGRKLAALLTLAGDGGKGWLAVFLAARYGAEYGASDTAFAECSVAVFLGHVFPVFLGFKGGKGVATAGGVLLALDPWLGLAALAIWAFVVVVTRYVSLASVVAAVSAPACALFMALSPGVLPALIFIGAVTVWRHRGNLSSLAAGKERKIGEKGGEGPGAGNSASAEKS